MADWRACLTLLRLLLPAEGDMGVLTTFVLLAANEIRGEYRDEGGAFVTPPFTCWG